MKEPSMKTLLFALGICIVPAMACADSLFDSIIKGAATEAARSVIGGASQQPAGDGVSVPATGATGAVTSTATTAPAAAQKPGCLRTRATPLPPLGPRPDSYAPAILWPEDTGCDYYKFSDLKFEQARAQKKAFVDASKVRCSDCEGGYSYDAWAHFFLVKGGDYSKKFSEMLIALKPGQSLKWKGSRFNGVVQATGEHPIGPYPCRQYHWTLKDGSKVVAERDGLYCEFKGDYAATARWQEIL